MMMMMTMKKKVQVNGCNVISTYLYFDNKKVYLLSICSLESLSPNTMNLSIDEEHFFNLGLFLGKSKKIVLGLFLKDV